MMTGKDYVESLKAMKPVVYAFGEKVESLLEHPCFRPTVNALALTPIFARQQAVIGVSDFFLTCVVKSRVLPESPRGFVVLEYGSSYIG